MTKLKMALLSLVALLAAGVLVVMLLPRPAQAQGQASTPLATTSCDCQETSFGDLAADSLRAAGNAQIGFIGAISFRAGTLPPGPITAQRVSQLLANPDEVWAVSRLTGAQIQQALEHSVRTAPLPNNGFLQVSGLSFSYSQGASREKRVTSVLAGGAPLMPEATYMVAMPLSLAKGGSGYFKFFTKDAIVTQGTSSLATAIVDFAQRQGSVSYSGVGRINVVP